MSRMLYILVPSYPLTDYLFEGLAGEPGIRVIPQPFGKKGKLKSLARIVEAYLLPGLKRSWYYGEEHVARLAEIQPEDSVLYFAIENRKDLQLTRKFIRARKQSIWLWNPVRTYRRSAISRWFYKLWLQHSGLAVHTFDPDDAREMAFKPGEQVYRQDSALAAGEPEMDVYFLGMDKGRLEELKRWKQDLEAQSLSSYFHIVADKRKQYTPRDEAWVTTAWMPYRKNLEHVRQCRVVLELLQGTQSGPTIRSMEALFLGRKLVTNNASILACDFYRPANIFVIGHDRPEALQAFMKSPMEAVDPQVLAKHEIRTWVNQFR